MKGHFVMAILLLIVCLLVVFGLMMLQLRSMKKYHPNAELLIGILKHLKPDAPPKMNPIPNSKSMKEYPHE
jgi:hypothetical protein